MKHDKKLINKIAAEVSSEYQMGGLSSGVYLAFATDVATRYAEALIKPNHTLIKAMEALDDYLNAGSKESRKQASDKAKALYKKFYGIEYINKIDRK